MITEEIYDKFIKGDKTSLNEAWEILKNLIKDKYSYLDIIGLLIVENKLYASVNIETCIKIHEVENLISIDVLSFSSIDLLYLPFKENTIFLSDEYKGSCKIYNTSASLQTGKNCIQLSLKEEGKYNYQDCVIKNFKGELEMNFELNF